MCIQYAPSPVNFRCSALNEAEEGTWHASDEADRGNQGFMGWRMLVLHGSPKSKLRSE